MIRQRANPITIIFFGTLVIVVGILVFTFCSFGTDTDAVMTGYEATRRYATDSKKLKASVDVFKNTVNNEINYQDDVKNHEATSYKDLPAFGTLSENFTYESFSSSFTIKANSGINPDGGGGPSPQVDINCGAKVNEGSAIFFTSDGKQHNKDDGTLYLYGGYQCIGFANYLLAENTGLTKSCNFGIWSPSKELLKIGCTWDAGVNKCVLSTAEDAKAFFNKVTPCTWVRTRPPAGQKWGHSYTILGADAEHVIIYDCNIDGFSGIQLRKVTYADIAKSTWFNNIQYVISPNSYLPDGCYKIGTVGGNSAIKRGGSGT